MPRHNTFCRPEPCKGSNHSSQLNDKRRGKWWQINASWIALFGILKVLRYCCQGQGPFLLFNACIHHHLQSNCPRIGLLLFRRTYTDVTAFAHGVPYPITSVLMRGSAGMNLLSSIIDATESDS